MKVAVIGDSFSCDQHSISWLKLLQSAGHTILNFSQRGIGQYRIYKNIVANIDQIKNCSWTVVWHTNPDRIYVNDHAKFASRNLHSHSHMDLMANDAMNSDAAWQAVASTYYKFFFDQDQQNLYHQLLVQEIQHTLLNSSHTVHCSGFDLPALPCYHSVKSFAGTRQQHPGDCNHFDHVGNQLVYEYISGEIA